jgi:UDP-glucose 4-epimerase
MHILVTGGAGYIGSHILVSLYEAGHTATVVDNLSNSDSRTIARVEKLVGATIPFERCDVRSKLALNKIFETNNFDAVIHCAGLKAVGESVQDPLAYYDNNVGGSITLFEVMCEFRVSTLIFSSSATVYGSAPVPYSEESPTGVGITNPYGQTKYMIEQIMHDICTADPTFSATTLRYFNPIGAHESGTIGENPKGTPNNLMPYIAQVATGKHEKLSIFGGDYDTPDCTALRDYIHVTDLADGHRAALNTTKPGYHVYNLGTGKATSVLELVHAFEKASGSPLPYEIIDRRSGDLSVTYANVTKAKRELSWSTEKSIDDACQDTWRWQTALKR